MAVITKNKKRVTSIREILGTGYTVADLADHIKKNYADGQIVEYKIKFRRNKRIEQLTFPICDDAEDAVPFNYDNYMGD